MRTVGAVVRSFPSFSDVVKLVPVQTVSGFVFAVIMANAPVGFPVPQMQGGLSAGKKIFAWKTLQLDTASTTNTLAVDDL